MQLEQGDAFERQNADWIRLRLPSYERIWSAFIGHDGNGRPRPIVGLSKDKERRRRLFYEGHYSLAKVVHRFDLNVGETLTGLGEVRDQAQLDQLLERFTLIVTLAGQARDMVKRIQEALNADETLFTKLQDIYDKRSNVLHAPSPPIRLDDGLLRVPKAASRNPRQGEWTSKATWDETGNGEFVFLSDWLQVFSEDFFKTLVESHAGVFSAANAYFEGGRIEQAPARLADSTLWPYGIPPSGSRVS